MIPFHTGKRFKTLKIRPTSARALTHSGFTMKLPDGFLDIIDNVFFFNLKLKYKKRSI